MCRGSRGVTLNYPQSEIPSASLRIQFTPHRKGGQEKRERKNTYFSPIAQKVSRENNNKRARRAPRERERHLRFIFFPPENPVGVNRSHPGSMPLSLSLRSFIYIYTMMEQFVIAIFPFFKKKKKKKKT